MTDFAILLAGPVTDTRRLRSQLQGRRVIAADRGISHAQKLDLIPELWLGDFDSAEANSIDEWRGIEQQSFPSDKDQTDGELAITEALERGAKSIIMVGGGGGPHFDHVLAHFCMSVLCRRQGVEAFCANGHEETYPFIPGSTRLSVPLQSRFSIIGFSDLRGLSVTGAKWTLKDIDVKFGDSRTLSNVAQGPLQLKLEEGYGVILVYPSSVS